MTDLLTPAELAVMLGMSVRTLANRRSNGKARFGDNKPTLTQRGIDVDAFICDNHTLIERLRKGTR